MKLNTWLLAVGLGISLNQTFAQTLQFTNVSYNAEGTIRLQWQSKTNAIYRVEYLDELQSSNNVWQTLYRDYPSHGPRNFFFCKFIERQTEGGFWFSMLR